MLPLLCCSWESHLVPPTHTSDALVDHPTGRVKEEPILLPPCHPKIMAYSCCISNIDQNQILAHIGGCTIRQTIVVHPLLLLGFPLFLLSPHPQPFHLKFFLLPWEQKGSFYLIHGGRWLCSPLDWIRWPSLNPIKSLCDT